MCQYILRYLMPILGLMHGALHAPFRFSGTPPAIFCRVPSRCLLVVAENVDVSKVGSQWRCQRVGLLFEVVRACSSLPPSCVHATQLHRRLLQCRHQYPHIIRLQRRVRRVVLISLAGWARQTYGSNVCWRHGARAGNLRWLLTRMDCL